MTTTLERQTAVARTPPPCPQWRPVVIATLAAGVLHLLWAAYVADGGGDLAAQYAWAAFALHHPGSAYNLAWYGGLHPPSYSVLSPYLMALLGVRTTGVIAGTLSATLTAVLLVRSGISRPLPPALWAAFALACNLLSGRVTFALGVLFGLAATAVAVETRIPRSVRAVAGAGLAVLATLASPVAGLFLEVAAAALFLIGRRRAAYALAVGPPVVVLASALLFPFKGVQPFPWFLVAAPSVIAVVLALRAPWRTVRAGSAVYAVGTVLTWAIPSQVGSNVDRLALLFGGALLLAAAMHRRRSTTLWLAFAAAAISQVTRPVFDLVSTSSARTQRSAAVTAELRRLGADRARVEVVPERTHLEAFELAANVDLARGWNRQADVERNGLFYDGSLTPQSYHDWLRRWAVRYVVLSDTKPDWPGVDEARIVRAGQPWLSPVWRNQHWSVYRVTDAAPMADPPAVVERASDGDVVLSMPVSGSVLVKVPWSPWLAVQGGRTGDACLARAGEWTRLRARAPGTYRLSAPYRLPRGTPC